MGKRIVARARGKGGPRYRAPGHRYAGAITYPLPGKAQVIDIIHDPGRDAPLAVVKQDRTLRLVVAAEGLKVGDVLEIGAGTAKIGNILLLDAIPKGSYIFAIEPAPGYGPKLCCSAGGHAVLISKEVGKVIVQMPSGQFKALHPRCLATIGIAAGGGREDKPFVKAGQAYYAKGARNKLWPRTAANRMNPVDHPFGGRTKPGQPKSVSRWAPPGAKIGSIASRRTGRRKR
jgi:large subunit ribosomal protein L2